jgi:hypothetical protein
MHEYYLHPNECQDAPASKVKSLLFLLSYFLYSGTHLIPFNAQDLFVLCRVTKREGSSTDADTSAPAEVVPNGLDQLSAVIDPVMHENLSTLSENIVGTSNCNNNNNNNNNYQQDDIEKWLHELFDPDISATSLEDQQFFAVPVSY